MASLDSLKVNIKSILSSSKATLTPRQLLQDFKDFEGYDFPFYKFGFRTFEECLDSPEMADTLTLKYVGGTRVIIPFVSANSAHISDLVAKQKSKTSRKPLRRSQPFSYRTNVPPRMLSSRRMPAARQETRPPRFTSSKSSLYQAPRASSYHSQSLSHFSHQSSQQFSTSQRSYNSTQADPQQSSSYHQQSSTWSTSSSAVTKSTQQKADYMETKYEDDRKRENCGKGNYSQPNQPSNHSPVIPGGYENGVGSFSEEDDYWSERECSDERGEQYCPVTTSTKPSVFEKNRRNQENDDSPELKESLLPSHNNSSTLNTSHLTLTNRDSTIKINGFHNVRDSYDNDSVERRLLRNSCKSRNSVSSFDSDSGGIDSVSEVMSGKMRQNFQLLLDEHPDGVDLLTLGSIYQERFHYPLNFLDMGYTSMIEFVADHPSIFFCYRLSRNGNYLIFDSKKDIPDKYKTAKEEEGSKRPKIPADIHENLKQLLMSKKKVGLLSSELLSSYQKKYSETLNIQELGFPDVNSLLIALSDLCYLRPVRNKIRAYPRIVNEEEKSDSESEVDQFHSPHKMNQLFPQEVCDRDCKIAQQPILDEFIVKDEGGRNFLEVKVSEVYSPGKFWFHLRAKVAEFYDMMTDLDNFYNEDEQNYVMPSVTIAIGQICAAKYEPDCKWHRVRISSIPSINEVTVYYLDFGTVAKVPKSGLRFLHRDFESLPAQAIRGRLHNLRPIKNNRWAPECSTDFLDLTEGRDLVGEIKNKQIKGEELEVDFILFDTTSSDDIIINEVLIEKGYAALKCSDPSELEVPTEHQANNSFNDIAIPQTQSENQDSSYQLSQLSSGAVTSGLSSTEIKIVNPPPGFKALETSKESAPPNFESTQSNFKSIANGWSSSNSLSTQIVNPSRNDQSAYVGQVISALMKTTKAVAERTTKEIIQEELEAYFSNSILEAVKKRNLEKSKNLDTLALTNNPVGPLALPSTQSSNQFSQSMGLIPNNQIQYPAQQPSNYNMSQNYYQSQQQLSNTQINSLMSNAYSNQMPPPGLPNPFYQQKVQGHFPNNPATHQSFPNQPFMQQFSAPNMNSVPSMYQNLSLGNHIHQNQHFFPNNSMPASQNPNLLNSNSNIYSHQLQHSQLPRNAHNLPVIPSVNQSNDGYMGPVKNLDHQSAVPNNQMYLAGASGNQVCPPGFGYSYNQNFIQNGQSLPNVDGYTRGFPNNPSNNQNANLVMKNNQAVCPNVQNYVGTNLYLQNNRDTQLTMRSGLKNLSNPANNLNSVPSISNASFASSCNPSIHLTLSDSNSNTSPINALCMQSTSNNSGQTASNVISASTPVDNEISTAEATLSALSNEIPTSTIPSTPEVSLSTSNSQNQCLQEHNSYPALSSSFHQSAEIELRLSPHSVEVANIFNVSNPKSESFLPKQNSYETTNGKIDSKSPVINKTFSFGQDVTSSKAASPTLSKTEDNSNHPSNFGNSSNSSNSSSSTSNKLYSSPLSPSMEKKLGSQVAASSESQNLLLTLFPQLEVTPKSESSAEVMKDSSVSYSVNSDHLSVKQRKKLESDPIGLKIPESNNWKVDWCNIDSNFSKNLSSKNIVMELKTDLTANEIKSDTPRTTVVKEMASSPVKCNELKVVVVADKSLLLLILENVAHIIVEEFLNIFTKITKRESMLKILEVQHVVLPFKIVSSKIYSEFLSEEELFELKKFEKFDKINVLPLKNTWKLVEVLTGNESHVGAFRDLYKKFDSRATRS